MIYEIISFTHSVSGWFNWFVLTYIWHEFYDHQNDIIFIVFMRFLLIYEISFNFGLNFSHSKIISPVSKAFWRKILTESPRKMFRFTNVVCLNIQLSTIQIITWPNTLIGKIHNSFMSFRGHVCVNTSIGWSSPNRWGYFWLPRSVMNMRSKFWTKLQVIWLRSLDGVLVRFYKSTWI